MGAAVRNEWGASSPPFRFKRWELPGLLSSAEHQGLSSREDSEMHLLLEGC